MFLVLWAKYAPIDTDGLKWQSVIYPDNAKAPKNEHAIKSGSGGLVGSFLSILIDEHPIP